MRTECNHITKLLLNATVAAVLVAVAPVLTARGSEATPNQTNPGAQQTPDAKAPATDAATQAAMSAEQKAREDYRRLLEQKTLLVQARRELSLLRTGEQKRQERLANLQAVCKLYDEILSKLRRQDAGL